MNSSRDDVLRALEDLRTLQESAIPVRRIRQELLARAIWVLEALEKDTTMKLPADTLPPPSDALEATLRNARYSPPDTYWVPSERFKAVIALLHEWHPSLNIRLDGAAARWVLRGWAIDLHDGKDLVGSCTLIEAGAISCGGGTLDADATPEVILTQWLRSGKDK